MHPFVHYTYILITFSWGLVCFIMGMTLLFLNIPDQDTLRTYKVSVRALAVNYLALTFLVFGTLFFGIPNPDINILSFTDLLIHTSQAIIYAFVFVSLYVPKYFALKKIKQNNLCPFVFLFASYFLCSFLFGDPNVCSIPLFFSNLTHPTIFIRFLFLLFSIYQIALYSIVLCRLRCRYRRFALQHVNALHLNIARIKISFYFIVLLGVLSLIASCCTNTTVHTIFTFAFGTFYFVFALLYMQYKRVCLKPEPLVDNRPEKIATGHIVAEQKYKLGWERTRDQILKEKLYLQPGITINDMAEKFNTNRTSFSTALNKHEGQNFNAFINQLRIDQAKQLMLENPELTIADISQKCGFTEQSNFTRQFRQICNDPPATWRKKASQMANSY